MAILSGVLLFSGFRFLKGLDVFKSSYKYYAVYSDVSGLTEGNAVIVNGLSVGNVTKIELIPGPAHAMLVTMTIDKKIKMGKQSEVVLTSHDILGTKVIDLKISDVGAMLQEEDTLKATIETPLTETLKQAAMPLVRNLDSSSQILNRLMHNFSNTSKQLDKTLATYEEAGQATNALIRNNQANVTGITTNMNALSHSLISTEKSLRGVLDKMNRIGDTLNKAQIAATVQQANQTLIALNKTLTGIEQGKGTLGKMVKTDSLHRNMNATLKATEALLSDLKEHPSRYVHFSIWGKKESKPTK